MLTVTIPAQELFNDETQKFIYPKETTLVLEHSLVSLSKWEQIWEKPFLGKDTRTVEETISYIKCMTITPENPPEDIFLAFPQAILDQIGEYINRKMTATWFSEMPGQRRTTEVITSEIIYYWMVTLQVDFETQYWHLNRLLTLLRVINIKNDPKKKMMPKRDAAAMQRQLNEERKAKFNTRG